MCCCLLFHFVLFLIPRRVSRYIPLYVSQYRLDRVVWLVSMGQRLLQLAHSFRIERRAHDSIQWARLVEFCAGETVESAILHSASPPANQLSNWSSAARELSKRRTVDVCVRLLFVQLQLVVPPERGGRAHACWFSAHTRNLPTQFCSDCEIQQVC